MARILYDINDVKPEDVRDLAEAMLLTNGKEYLSDKKMFVHAESAPRTLKEQVERIIGSYIWNAKMREKGFESVDEFEDFDIPDEDTVKSGYEYEPMDDLQLPPEDLSNSATEGDGEESSPTGSASEIDGNVSKNGDSA